MRRIYLTAIIAFLMIAITTIGHTTPIAINIGDFSGNETIIDFNSIANMERISNQFSGDGVTFDEALYGWTNYGDINLFPNSGGVIASNWGAFSGGGIRPSFFTAEFDSIQTKVGFYFEAWPEDIGTVTVENNGISSGSLTFSAPPVPSGQLPSNVIFVGLEDSIGFDKITLSTEYNITGYYGIDDFRFEESQPIPEPGTMLLFGSGLIGLAGFRRKLKKTRQNHIHSGVR